MAGYVNDEASDDAFEKRRKEWTTPAPIATPEEVRAGQIVDRIVAEWVYFHGEADRQGLWDIATREVAKALASSNAEIERLTGEREHWLKVAQQKLADLQDLAPRYEAERVEKYDLKARVATLTDQVGRMREALSAIAGPGWSPFDVDSAGANTAGQIIAEMQRVARAALSPTEPDAMEK